MLCQQPTYLGPVSPATDKSNKGIRYFRGNDLVVSIHFQSEPFSTLKYAMQQSTPYSNNSGKEKLVICEVSCLP